MGRDRAAWIRACGAALAAIGISGPIALGGARAAAPPVTTSGYVAMADGVELRYTLVRPASTGRFPVLMVLDPYDAGNGPTDDGIMAALLGENFAFVGVNLRGTGCSGGVFDLFQPNDGPDGAAMVEWAAAQPWSTGHVGLYGASYPGIVQFEIAAQQPPHLDAIAPGQVVGDLYRDPAYPGGIFNRAFAALFTGLQKQSSEQNTAAQVAAGDTQCATNHAQHLERHTPFDDTMGAPFIDSPSFAWESHSPDSSLRRIRVPVLTTHSWQDEEVGSRISYLYEHLDPSRLWTVQSNGGHNGMYESIPFDIELLKRFFRHYLAGAPNRWESTPHFNVLHELSTDLKPGWVSATATWPPATQPLTLFVRDSGALGLASPTNPVGQDSYTYPEMSPSAPPTDAAGAPVTNAAPGWTAAPPAGGYLAYTTPAFSRDVDFMGSGAADLWLASTATDTDLQVTLTEVRPDGTEVYLERGWLRASHRKEDIAASTLLRPLHTDRQADASPLIPGAPTEMRVELRPFEHVFRRGSSLRLIVDAPTGMTGDWGLDFLNAPATNTVLHDATHPSRFLLPMVSGAAETPQPTCGTVLLEACRVSIAPVPPGALDIPPFPAGDARAALVPALPSTRTKPPLSSWWPLPFVASWLGGGAWSRRRRLNPEASP